MALCGIELSEYSKRGFAPRCRKLLEELMNVTTKQFEITRSSINVTFLLAILLKKMQKYKLILCTIGNVLIHY